MDPQKLMALELVFQSDFLTGLVCVDTPGHSGMAVKRVNKPVMRALLRWILQYFESHRRRYPDQLMWYVVEYFRPA